MPVRKIGEYGIKMLIIFLVAFLTKFAYGNLGYLSLADLAIMLLAKNVTPSYGLIIAGLPVALASILRNSTHYSVLLFISKAIEGFLMALLYKNNKVNALNSILLAFGIYLLNVISDVYLYDFLILKTSILLNGIMLISNVGLFILYLHFTKNRK